MVSRRRYQGVTAYVGMPGSGKSYALVERALRSREQGRSVWTNAGFEVEGCSVFQSFEEFLAIPDGAVICFDEMPLYFNARRWQEFPDGLLYRLTQIRKHGLELHYSAIHEMMVDTTIRRLTFWWWTCRSLGLGLMRRDCWPPEAFRRTQSRPVDSRVFRIRRKVTRAYDTMARVAVPAARATALGDLGALGGTWGTPGPAAALAPGRAPALQVGAESQETPAAWYAAPDMRPVTKTEVGEAVPTSVSPPRPVYGYDSEARS